MKQSSSTTSLSRLEISDTGCFVCSEDGNLHDSKEFETCKCRFSFHTECMKDWFETHPNECPLCSVRLIKHKIDTVFDSDLAVQEPAVNSSLNRFYITFNWKLYAAIFIVVFIISFISALIVLLYKVA